MDPARRPFSCTRVCEVVHIAGDADETSKYIEVDGVDKKTWCGTPILSRR